MKRQDRALCAKKTKQLTARGPEVQCARPRRAKAPSRRPGHGGRPRVAKGARAPRDEATVACQKSGMYPTFDSAAGMGQIPLIPGFIPYLILMVAGFDSAAGPIPVKGKHCVSLTYTRVVAVDRAPSSCARL